MTLQQEKDLVSSASLFIRTLTDIKGSDCGMQLWERIAEVLDTEFKGKIFLSLLSSNYGTIVINPLHSDELKQVEIHKITIIRCIRLYTGLGLKEAISIIKEILAGRTVKISVDPKDTIKVLNELRTYGINA